jgi:hypothetical protein
MHRCKSCLYSRQGGHGRETVKDGPRELIRTQRQTSGKPTTGPRQRSRQKHTLSCCTAAAAAASGAPTVVMGPTQPKCALVHKAWSKSLKPLPAVLSSSVEQA